MSLLPTHGYARDRHQWARARAYTSTRFNFLFQSDVPRSNSILQWRYLGLEVWIYVFKSSKIIRGISRGTLIGLRKFIYRKKIEQFSNMDVFVKEMYIRIGTISIIYLKIYTIYYPIISNIVKKSWISFSYFDSIKINIYLFNILQINYVAFLHCEIYIQYLYHSSKSEKFIWILWENWKLI